MTFIPSYIIEKLSGRYSPNSLATMDQQIKRYFKALGLDEYDSGSLLDINIFKNTINGFTKSTVRKSICNTCIQILKTFRENPDDLIHHRLFFKQIAHDHMHEYLFQEPNEKDKENQITLTEVRNKYASMLRQCAKSNDLGLNQKFAILACYTLFPPLRSQDWCNLRVIDSKTRKGRKLTTEYDALTEQHKANIYNKHRGELFLRFGKTAPIHGTRVLQVPPLLKKILNSYHAMHNGDYLFCTKSGEPYTHNGFNAVLCSLFAPRNVSSSMLRKVYISEKCPQMTRAECHELARTMGHSVIAQQMIYKRFD